VPTVEVPLVEAPPPIEMPVVEVLAPLSAADDTPPGFTPPQPSTPVATPVTPVEVSPPVEEPSSVADVVMPTVEVPPSAEVMVPPSVGSAALEDFTSSITKDIPLPLLDLPSPRCRRVDPVLIDTPFPLPSSKVFGLRRSHFQALDPLSVVKPAKRETVLLARRLGETGAPPASVSAADEVVDNFFRDGHQPHRMDALQTLFPMLKNVHKIKISPLKGSSVD
jgi:hypothetical protein